MCTYRPWGAALDVSGSAGCRHLAAEFGLDDLVDDRTERCRELPLGVGGPETAKIADVADVVAFAVLLDVLVVEGLTDPLFDELDRLEDRGAVLASATQVEHSAWAGSREEGVEGGHHVAAVDLVADLLALVSEDAQV